MITPFEARALFKELAETLGVPQARHESLMTPVERVGYWADISTWCFIEHLGIRFNPEQNLRALRTTWRLIEANRADPRIAAWLARNETSLLELFRTLAKATPDSKPGV